MSLPSESKLRRVEELSKEDFAGMPIRRPPAPFRSPAVSRPSWAPDWRRPYLYDEEDIANSTWEIASFFKQDYDRLKRGDQTAVYRTVVRCNDDDTVAWADLSWPRQQGTWRFDGDAYLTIRRSLGGGLLGRRLFKTYALRNYYYCEGIIQGWRPWQPIEQLGFFQARRLGFSDAERGPPPWLDRTEERSLEWVRDARARREKKRRKLRWKERLWELDELYANLKDTGAS